MHFCLNLKHYKFKHFKLQHKKVQLSEPTETYSIESISTDQNEIDQFNDLTDNNNNINDNNESKYNNDDNDDTSNYNNDYFNDYNNFTINQNGNSTNYNDENETESVFRTFFMNPQTSETTQINESEINIKDLLKNKENLDTEIDDFNCDSNTRANNLSKDYYHLSKKEKRRSYCMPDDQEPIETRKRSKSCPIKLKGFNKVRFGAVFICDYETNQYVGDLHWKYTYKYPGSDDEEEEDDDDEAYNKFRNPSKLESMKQEIMLFLSDNTYKLKKMFNFSEEIANFKKKVHSSIILIENSKDVKFLFKTAKQVQKTSKSECSLFEKLVATAFSIHSMVFNHYDLYKNMYS
ncbi:uncharacterized protein KGF55_005700 [Candida pseudojiufengensis]|uniref:uncharacterized protein n=1 Tax=Candida pseudojiufengensis TaxID=497109 RepID=UPI002224B06B|nr:uncharacterized protein KGF55_005700 [Candida pseudojiufengensis]KAI5958702.1 hypothetical protein KGF55_005700 [Candida pseudojiufengensis]